MFVPYAGEIWTKSYGPNYEIMSFLTKTNKQTKKQTNKETHFFITILDEELTPCSVAEIIG